MGSCDDENRSCSCGSGEGYCARHEVSTFSKTYTKPKRKKKKAVKRGVKSPLAKVPLRALRAEIKRRENKCEHKDKEKTFWNGIGYVCSKCGYDKGVRHL